MFHCGLCSLRRKCCLAFLCQPSLLGRFFLGIGGVIFVFNVWVVFFFFFFSFFSFHWSEESLFSLFRMQGMTGSELARAFCLDLPISLRFQYAP